MEANIQKDKIIIKKKKCIPLKEFDVDINTDYDEETLIKYVSYFDLNPKANFYVFQNIKSYNKYLEKYKHTLFYEDAKKLGCFKDVDEEELIININKYLENLGIKDRKINKIKSLSKAKLINFILYLLNLGEDIDNFEEIINTIESFKLQFSLIFKAPISLGNSELQYYFFYELFIEFFLYNYEDIKDTKQSKFMPKEEEFFPVTEEKNNEYYEIDMTDFEKRKKELKEFLNGKSEKRKKINEEPNEIKKIIELNEELEQIGEVKNNLKKKNVLKKEKEMFEEKLEYFNNFRDVLINIFLMDIKDEECIEKINYYLNLKIMKPLMKIY